MSHTNLIVVFSVLCLATLGCAQDLLGAPRPDYLKCRNGRNLYDRRCSPFQPDSCPRGFFCQGGPADQPGPCCLLRSPCDYEVPFTIDGDAPTCAYNRRCPRNHRCRSGRGFAVCCPRRPPFPGCPNEFCTLQVIDPECRYYPIRFYRGRLCTRCPIDICRPRRG